MTVSLVCSNCGHHHKMGDRVFDGSTGTTCCPNCETRDFSVDHDIDWHNPDV